MKKIAQLVPSEITKEAEAVEVVVVDHDKCDDQNNHSIGKLDHDDLSKNGEANIHGAG